MKIVACVSGKGGVGKSTLTVNLAAGLVARDQRVLVVDLDPQNAARIHLGLDPQDVAGLAREGLHADVIFESPYGIHFVPFGQMREDELERFESYLRAHPDWLRDSLAGLDPDSYDFVLVDTPPGATLYLQQVLRAADQLLVVVLADAASLATLPRMTRLIEQQSIARHAPLPFHIVLNQSRPGSKLGHQVRKTLAKQYADVLVPVAIPSDPSVAQAMAFERPVLNHEAQSAGSLSFQGVADWLLDDVNA